MIVSWLSRKIASSPLLLNIGQLGRTPSGGNPKVVSKADASRASQTEALAGMLIAGSALQAKGTLYLQSSQSSSVMGTACILVSWIASSASLSWMPS